MIFAMRGRLVDFFRIMRGAESLNSSRVGESFANAEEMRGHVSSASVDPRSLGEFRPIPHIQKIYVTHQWKFAPFTRTLLKVRVDWICPRLAGVTNCIRRNSFKAAILKSKRASG